MEKPDLWNISGEYLLRIETEIEWKKLLSAVFQQYNGRFLFEKSKLDFRILDELWVKTIRETPARIVTCRKLSYRHFKFRFQCLLEQLDLSQSKRSECRNLAWISRKKILSQNSDFTKIFELFLEKTRIVFFVWKKFIFLNW